MAAKPQTPKRVGGCETLNPNKSGWLRNLQTLKGLGWVRNPEGVGGFETLNRKTRNGVSSCETPDPKRSGCMRNFAKPLKGVGGRKPWLGSPQPAWVGAKP